MKTILLPKRQTTAWVILASTFLIGVATAVTIQHFMLRSESAPCAITINGELLEQEIEDAFALYKNNDLDAAIARYTQLLFPDERFAKLHMQMAMAHYKKNNHKDAIHYAKQAIVLNKNLVSAYLLLGRIISDQGKHDEAITLYKKTIALFPNYAETYNSLANEFMVKKNYEQAFVYAHKAFDLDSKNTHHALTLGYLCNYTGDISNALKYYQIAMDLNPNSSNAIYNYGHTLKNNNQFQEAIPYLKRAIELKHHYPDAHIALSHSYWSIGDFEHAWPEYEWRWCLYNFNHEAFSKGMWNGTDSLVGKTIMLFSEQGFGDTLQFIRYAHILKEKGARVICKVQGPLKTLLSQCPYIDEIAIKSEGLKYDYYAGLLSLPRILKTSPTTIPSTIPYLYIDKKLLEFWQHRLAADKNLKVGICWSVEAEHELTKFPSGLRTVPVELFGELNQIKGVSFYSLQKSVTPEELKRFPADFKLNYYTKDFDASHGRFMDTAALIANMDLIISVDTAVIHLAGGLGKTVWMLLPYSADCRWNMHAKDTPWYPTMELFRAPTPGDWRSAMNEIKTRLSQYRK